MKALLLQLLSQAGQSHGRRLGLRRRAVCRGLGPAVHLLAVSLKLLHQKFHESIFIPQFLKSFSQPGQNQTCNAETLIKGRPGYPVAQRLTYGALQNLIHLILILIFIIQLQIIGKILCNSGVLDILADYIPVSSFFQTLIDQDQLG